MSKNIICFSKGLTFYSADKGKTIINAFKVVSESWENTIEGDTWKTKTYKELIKIIQDINSVCYHKLLRILLGSGEGIYKTCNVWDKNLTSVVYLIYLAINILIEQIVNYYYYYLYK